MQTQYFCDLRQGTLSIPAGFKDCLQHYITNLALNKGFALCMVKYAHDADCTTTLLTSTTKSNITIPI